MSNLAMRNLKLKLIGIPKQRVTVPKTGHTALSWFSIEIKCSKFITFVNEASIVSRKLYYMRVANYLRWIAVLYFKRRIFLNVIFKV